MCLVFLNSFAVLYPRIKVKIIPLMSETKTTQYRIERDTGISGASMYNWLFGKSIPKMESIVRLAEYMEVSVDYLLGRIN